MRWMIYFMVLAAPALPAANPNTNKGFDALLRHGHYFLIWNTLNQAPSPVLTCVGVGRYTMSLRYQVIDANSRVLTEGLLPPGQTKRIEGLPLSPLYLVYGDPEYNGFRFQVDRPYGIVADARRRLGLNRPRGTLFFYVPSKCERFRVVVQCNSPKEGARVEVCRPDGSLAAFADGELDSPTSMNVTVPLAKRNSVWAIAFKKPTEKGLFLDDVNVYLEGHLPHLVTPRREWARDLIPKLPTPK